jgi:pyruvate/2-oxoglutarate dehydrogenase complex dihydrolipoamide acyltransferase (E2) component
MVISVAVSPGDEVAEGARLVTLEAMKAELAVVAPFAGKVRALLVTRNVQVAQGAPLIELERLDEEPRGAGPPPAFDSLRPSAMVAPAPRPRWARAAADLRRLLLGFDLEPGEARQISAGWIRATAEAGSGDLDLLATEQELLSIFTDTQALFRRQPAGAGEGEPGARSAAEHLTTFVRFLGRRGKDLPPAFLDKLRRALAHHGHPGHPGAPGLERTRLLEDALVRIYKFHERAEVAAAALAATLERWLRELAPPEGTGESAQRTLLDRLLEIGRASCRERVS